MLMQEAAVQKIVFFSPYALLALIHMAGGWMGVQSSKDPRCVSTHNILSKNL